MKKCSPLDGQNGQLVYWWGAGFTLAQSDPACSGLEGNGGVHTICLCYSRVCMWVFWHAFFVAALQLSLDSFPLFKNKTNMKKNEILLICSKSSPI
jgi:hypothetical protein